jgi:hypothetical protein
MDRSAQPEAALALPVNRWRLATGDSQPRRTLLEGADTFDVIQMMHGQRLGSAARVALPCGALRCLRHFTHLASEASRVLGFARRPSRVESRDSRVRRLLRLLLCLLLLCLLLLLPSLLLPRVFTPCLLLLRLLLLLPVWSLFTDPLD